MTLDEIVKIVQIEARQVGSIKPLTDEQINLLLKKANIDYFNNKYGFIKEGIQPERNQKVADDLQKFKTLSAISLTVGVGSLPANYFHAITLALADTEVDVVTENEWYNIIGDSILDPTTDYPIAIIRNDQVNVRPTSISSVNLVYYRYPTDPNYVRAASNGIFTYSSGSSTEFEWPESEHIALIRYILSYLGLSISEQQLLSYTETKKVEEE